MIIETAIVEGVLLISKIIGVKIGAYESKIAGISTKLLATTYDNNYHNAMIFSPLVDSAHFTLFCSNDSRSLLAVILVLSILTYNPKIL